MLWPREAVAFLRELEENNDRDWFKANRARYDEHLATPRAALALQLAAFGRSHAFRPYHDTRFHPGPPIKEQVGLAFGFGGGGGFYVELSLDGIFVAAGLHNPQADQVARLRAAIDDGRRAAGLTKGIAAAQAAGLALGEPDLKRGPRGYAPDHPRADLLRHRRVMVSQRHRLGAWVHKPGAEDRVREQFEAAQPLVTWLRKHVGPTANPDRR